MKIDYFLIKKIDKFKTVQDFKISADAADSLCTMNRRNRQKVETSYYQQMKGWIAISQS